MSNEMTTYQERAAKMNKKAWLALVKSAAKDIEVAQQEVSNATRSQLIAVNRMRTAGIKLQEAASHEQLSFNFWRSIQDHMPKGTAFAVIKLCAYLAKRFATPIKTLDEFRAARQMLFEAFGEASAPKRLEAQVAHESNPWSDFVSGASSFMSLFQKLESEPMESWDRTKLGAFVRETAPIAEKHQKAAALLKAV